MWRLFGRLGDPRVTTALGLGLALLGVTLAIVLSGSPTVLARTNSVPADQPIFTATSGTGACQSGETVPAGVTAIRLIFVAVIGPHVDVTVASPSGLLDERSIGNGWTAGAVTVPIKPLAHPVVAARICFRVARTAEVVEVGGSATAPSLAARTLTGKILPGRFTVEYLRSAHSSWWSSAQTVARRLGLGHAPSGTWPVLLLLLAMGSVLAGTCWLALRELR
ncbi:MAG: hypothetical protein ACRDJ3_11985 [Solirubrobacteraceae bacterium]